jgi:hypothetical protein
MEISKDTFVLFCLFIIYIGGDIYTARIEHKKIDKHVAEAESWSAGAAVAHAYQEKQIDSLKSETKALARTVLYLDSCLQAKTQKADRAEKRGRFVGGLLKGLFPGM